MSASAENERMEALIRRFEIPLTQFATRIVGNRERARDVVQETFIKFQRNGVSRLHGGTEPATWLFTVCRNAALNVCRKERRMLFLGEELMESRKAEQQTPFEQIEQEEAAGFLLHILATLPPRQQEVIQLKFQSDLSYKQIAEVTHTTANNVGVLIHTALKTLRERYAKTAKDFLVFESKRHEP